MTHDRITPHLSDYDPYGDTPATAGANDDLTVPPASAFGGLRLLPEADVSHARCRDCSPRLGRWVQSDPVGYVEGANPFSFVRGDAPPSADDPAGSGRT